MLCSWWICQFSVSMRAYDLHGARPRANITDNLMFPMCHSMRKASRMKLQLVPEHLYISRFLGVAISNFIYCLLNVLNRINLFWG